MSVQRAIRIAQGILKPIRKLPDTGLAIFCGRVRSSNGIDEDEVAEVITPPLPIKTNSYRCDKCFHTALVRPLFRIHRRYGYVVINSDQSYVGITEGTKRTILFKADTDLATNTRRGGQSALRISRLRDEQRHNYRHKILDACPKHLRDVEGIIVAGNADLPQEVHDLIVADTRLLTPVLGVLRVSTSATFEDIIHKSLDLIQSEDVIAEKEIVGTIQDYLCSTPDILVFGRKNIVECAENYLLDYVVVESGNDIDGVENKVLSYSSFLSSYDGAIGVLYFPGSANFLFEFETNAAE